MIFGRMRLFGLGIKHHEEPCLCRAFIVYLSWFALVFPVNTCVDHQDSSKGKI